MLHSDNRSLAAGESFCLRDDGTPGMAAAAPPPHTPSMSKRGLGLPGGRRAADGRTEAKAAAKAGLLARNEQEAAPAHTQGCAAQGHLPTLAYSLL
jgi:hypothetical protein